MDRETYDYEWKHLREMIRKHYGSNEMFPLKIYAGQEARPIYRKQITEMKAYLFDIMHLADW